MRSRWHIYIRPVNTGGFQFKFDGTGYIEVTSDVIMTSIGDVVQALDNTEFDVGLFRMQNFTFSILNYAGRYSDPFTQAVGSASIFNTGVSRAYSQVKLTWEEEYPDPIAGISTASNNFLSSEQTVFEGLIDDSATLFDPVTRTLTFTVLGLESLFSLNQPLPLVNGTISSILMLAMINRTPASSYLTISATNFTYKTTSPLLDPGTDDVSTLQTLNGLDCISGYLPSVNAVLYIRNYVVFITNRSATANPTIYLRGQGSSAGPENILLIENVTFGLSKLFNYVQWSGTSPQIAKDTTSISTFGCKTKTISYAWFTNSTTQGNIVTTIKNEFYLPQIEMDVTTPLNFTSVAVNLLDQVYLDLPDLSTANNTAGVSRYYSQMYLGTRFKVTSKTISVKDSTIKFHLRAY